MSYVAQACTHGNDPMACRFCLEARVRELEQRLARYEETISMAIDCLIGACPYLHGGTNDNIADRLRQALTDTEET